MSYRKELRTLISVAFIPNLADIILGYVPELSDKEALTFLLLKPRNILDEGKYRPDMLLEFSLVYGKSKIQQIESVHRKEWTRLVIDADEYLNFMMNNYFRSPSSSGDQASEKLWAMVLEYNGTIMHKSVDPSRK